MLVGRRVSFLREAFPRVPCLDLVSLNIYFPHHRWDLSGYVCQGALCVFVRAGLPIS